MNDPLPLFPLQAVLLPGAALGLRVFERRYLDMVAECGRSGRGFGICLILAGEEVGASIDSARERIGEAREDMTRRGQDQVRDWREQFGNAADDALRELGRWAIHGQRNPDALTELSKEISQRQAELSA